MKNFSGRLLESEMIRYLISGGMTTGVNLFMFTVLSYVGISVNTANLLSIATAVIFAFFVNRCFVFEIRDRSGRRMASEFIRFAGMRMGTLAIEFFGVYFLNSMLGIFGFISKCLVQILIIVINYVISKFVVFKEKGFGGVTNE